MSHLPFGRQNQATLAFAIPIAGVSAASAEQHIRPLLQNMPQATASAETAVTSMRTPCHEKSSAEGSSTQLVHTAASVHFVFGALVRKVLAEAVMVMAQSLLAHVRHNDQVYSHSKAQHSTTWHSTAWHGMVYHTVA